MKNEMPVRIFADACKKARLKPGKAECPLYPRSTCCEQECNVPKFVRWLMSNVTDPANVEEVD